ncbi:MAG: flagellar filament capping protein FliD [Pirellulales bacterium]
MGTISSAVGLISGLNIQDIVSQLIELEKRPVQTIQTKIEATKSQQTAFLGLSASLLSLQLRVGSLSSPSVLKARTATTSAPDILTATAAANAPLASYQVRPVRQAQPQQLISSGFADATSTSVGAGTISVKLGGQVSTNTSLDTLNGGQGVQRGKIRITDRSGATAVVDLTTARNVNDVLQAVNNNTNISVRATVDGDRIVLQDLTGQTTASLNVAEAGSTTTAANLGLLGTAAGNTHTGSDVVRLSAALRLDTLNDGNGVRKAASVPDFKIDLKDGGSLEVDLGSASTLGSVIDLINNHADNGGKVTASIDAGGEHLKLTDNTGGGGTLSVSALSGSQAAADLGILGSEQAGGVLDGQRILSGLNTVLLSSLRGGSQTLTKGEIQISRTGGGTTNIDLGSASTLADVVAAINAGAAGIGVSAAVNSSGDGLVLTDATGGASAISVTDLSGDTAAYLKLTGASVAGKLDSGDLSRRYISDNTRLDRLNGGAGIQRGVFNITDRNGQSATIDLTDTAKQTVGDVLLALNSTGLSITARINDTGDGILIAGTSGSAQEIAINDLGGTTAKSLRLAGAANASHEIDGAFRYDIEISADDKLNDVVQKLTASGAPITASVINDGGGLQPFRLLLGSSRAGEAGSLVVNTGTTNLSFGTLNEASDSVLEVGGSGTNNLLFASNSNEFSQILPGLSVNVLGASTTAVTVTVGQNNQALTDAVNQIADSFNSLAGSLATLTSFNTTTGERGPLQADSTARQLQNALFAAFTDSSGSSSIRSLAQIGLTFKDGRVSFDETVLQNRITTDPAAVQEFLGNAETGVGVRIRKLIDTFTSPLNGSLTRHVDELNSRVTSLEERTEFLNERLEAKRLRLLRQYNGIELALAKVQSQTSAITSLAQLAATTISSQSTRSN